MSDISASVILRLVDDITGPAKKAAASVKGLIKDVERLSKVGSQASGLKKQIDALGRQAREASSSVKALREGFSRPISGNFAKGATAGFERIRREAQETTLSVRSLRREMSKGASFNGRGLDRVGRASLRGGSEDVSGRKAVAGIAAVAAAHEAASFARESLETYREFDRERRFSGAVMGIKFEDQAALVRQAISMGGRTKYNDIAVLEGQRELAARGLGKDSILGMMPAAANLGMSLDMSLPDAVKLMDQAVFGFKKSIGSVADAAKSATQTADAQVKAAKISGMSPADIAAVYRFGATPAKISGVSEETLLAFGGIEKRANIGGDMAGTAFRALIAAAQAPTRGAKEALLANNLDYSKYQPKLTNIPVDPFVRNVAAQYGVALNKQAIASLTRVFTNPTLLNDQSKFAPAVVDALGDTLGKKESKSLKSIAGMANRFRNSIGGGADVNAFLADLMLKLPGNLKLSNALFGAKQGSRIATALGDPEVLKALKDQLANHSAGYAQNISDQRMAGFDGAVSRFEGAVKNLQTAVGRAFDAECKGGFLTSITGQLASWTQAFAEAPAQVQRLGVEAAAVAAIFAGWKGAEALLGGFGLKGAAASLTEAAAALKGAAGIKSAEGGLSGGSKGLMPLGMRGAIAGANLGLAGFNAPSDFDPKTKSIDFNGPTPEQRFQKIWDRYVPSFGDLMKLVVPSAHAERAQGGFGDLSGNPFRQRSAPSILGPHTDVETTKGGFGDLSGNPFKKLPVASGSSLVAPIESAVNSTIPAFAAAGGRAMDGLAAGLEAGSGRATSSMMSLMANLAAIGSKGIMVDVDLNTAGAEAKLNSLLSRANAVSVGGGKTPQFGKSLNDGVL